MDKKMTVLLVALFCLLCVGSYLIFEPARHISYHEVNLTDTCVAKVPVTDKVSSYTDNLNIHYYSDYENDLNITSFYDVAPESSSQGHLRMDNLKKEVLGTEKGSAGNLTYYKNNNAGTYTMYVEDRMSHNYILLSAKDLTIFTNVYSSLEARIVVNETDIDSLDSSYA
ncbi:hypothetical protein [Methanobrevibacter ruminantium]|nr:hypothetical protein [Methanobrevibacter ruminantium]